MKCSTPKCTRKPEEGKKQCSVCLASKRKYRIANHTAILVGEKEYKRRIRRAALAKLGTNVSIVVLKTGELFRLIILKVAGVKNVENR